MSSKTISDGLVLETKDTVNKAGDVVAMAYSLRCSKPKRCVFEIDFSGSTNLELSDGGLVKKTNIAPFAEERVALLMVVDPKRPVAHVHH